MSNSVRPHRRKPTRLPGPQDSPGKNTGVGCHFLLQCMKVKSLNHVPLFMTPWTAAYQASPSMGFSRQEYWSGVPSPSLIRMARTKENEVWQYKLLPNSGEVVKTKPKQNYFSYTFFQNESSYSQFENQLVSFL